MMKEEEKEEVTDILREILKWIKFSGMKEVKSVLLSVLDSEQKKLAYHLSDGTKATREIGEVVGIHFTTVAGYWKSWLKLGLGENIAVRGGQRFQRSFDLEDLGIEIPSPKRFIPETHERRVETSE